MPSKFFIHQQVWLKHLLEKRLKGMWGVYLSSVLRILGMSLIGIFIPVYIYVLSKQIQTVLIFYVIYNLTVVITVPLAGKLMEKRGVDFTAVVGAVVRAVFFVLMILSAERISFLFWAALVWGVAVPLTWLPYHYTVVSEDDGDGIFGNQVAYLTIAEKFTSAIAPFAGGLLIYFFGFNWLYTIGIGLVVLSVLPLLLDDFNKKKMRFNLKRVLKKMIKKEFLFFNLSSVGYGLESMVFQVIRPLFIYLILLSIPNLGAIESTAMVLNIFVAFWVGKWVEKKGFGIMKWGVVGGSLIILLLPVFKNTLGLFAVSGFYTLIALLAWIPYLSIIYAVSQKRRRLEFFMVREMILRFASGLFMLGLIFVFKLNPSWLLIFGFGSLGLLLALFILKDVNYAKTKTAV